MFPSACSRAPPTIPLDARRPRPEGTVVSRRGNLADTARRRPPGARGPTLLEKPLEGFPDDRRRDAVPPFVLAVGDVVAEVLEPWHEAPAGHVDRHDRI